MPLGVAALGAMGVEVPPWGRTPFIGIRYVDGDVVAEGRFPRGPGWGVRRTALMHGMIARAQTLGVDLRYGCDVTSWERTRGGVAVFADHCAVRARLLIGADGLHSRVRQQAGLACEWRGARRFGVRRHFSLRPWSSFVEVHWTDGAEAYITPAGPDRVGVALLWDGSGGSFDALLARFPRVRARLGDAPAESEPCGAGPFRQGVRHCHADRVALVGDAAGYLDAITGEGLTLAFHSAHALVTSVREGRSLGAYGVTYRRLSRTYYLMTALLLWVQRHPRLRRRVMRALVRYPELFDRFLAINAGEWPISSLGVGGVLRLIEGVLR
jgi:flavin-dependent dehydrogenase